MSLLSPPIHAANVAEEAPPTRARLRRGETLDVATQLSVMLETGVPLDEALRCCAEEAAKPHVAEVMEDVAASVEAGSDLSSSLQRHPNSFPQMLVSLVRAGEKGGMLPRMLERACGYLQDEAEIRRRVKGAMTYPAIMLGFALCTTIAMLTFVLPRFTGMYAGKEDRLPVPTKMLMAVSDALLYQWHLLVPGGVVAVLAGAWYLRTPVGRDRWHTVQLRLPLVGPMLRQLHLARGLRVVGTLAASGVNLVDCVETARELSGNNRFADLWLDVEEEIRQGRPFSEALRDSPLVPPAVATMILSGEKGGRLAAVTDKVAGHAEAQLKESIAELTRYIEPTMIVLMGALIGGVTLAMLLPVFTVSRVMAGG